MVGIVYRIINIDVEIHAVGIQDGVDDGQCSDHARGEDGGIGLCLFRSQVEVAVPLVDQGPLAGLGVSAVEGHAVVRESEGRAVDGCQGDHETGSGSVEVIGARNHLQAVFGSGPDGSGSPEFGFQTLFGDDEQGPVSSHAGYCEKKNTERKGKQETLHQ